MRKKAVLGLLMACTADGLGCDALPLLADAVSLLFPSRGGGDPQGRGACFWVWILALAALPETTPV